MMNSFWSRIKSQLQERPAAAWFVGIVLLLFIMVLVVLSRGSAASTAALTEEPGPTDTLRLIVDVILKFGIVLVLIYAFFQALQRFRPGTRKTVQGQMNVLETLKLSQQQTLYMVKVHEEIFLLGGTDQNLTMLSALDLPADLLQSYQAQLDGQDFSTLFRKAFQSGSEDQDEENPSEK